MGSHYDPLLLILYIIKAEANNFYVRAMSRTTMPNGYFKLLRKNECRDSKQLFNHAEGSIAIFDTILFDNIKINNNKKVVFVMST